jgi:GTP-binding protein Era
MSEGLESESRCGYAAIIGRPNVGKSTLMNCMLGQKISITAHKPQTTRHQILGIKTVPKGQIVFIDTPGIHLKTTRAINRYMNKAATAILKDVDLVVWVLEAESFTDEDRHIAGHLREGGIVPICVINKVDLVKDKQRLLPFAEELDRLVAPGEMLMVSAKTGKGLDELERRLLDRLPFSRPFYDEDQITDRSERFLAAEFIREQITRRLHQELPYSSTVEIEGFEHDGDLVRISAVIWVERDGQKAIVIGKKGQTLKAIGQHARESLEKLLDSRVHLQTWVKVKSGWSDDERALQSFGYKQ